MTHQLLTALRLLVVYAGVEKTIPRTWEACQYSHVLIILTYGLHVLATLFFTEALLLGDVMHCAI